MGKDALFFAGSNFPTMEEVWDKWGEYLRDPVEPYGYGHGRDPKNPSVGKFRFIRSNQPGGLLVVPNEEDSPNAVYSAFDWEALPTADGAFLGTLKGEGDGQRRSRKRA